MDIVKKPGKPLPKRTPRPITDEHTNGTRCYRCDRKFVPGEVTEPRNPSDTGDTFRHHTDQLACTRNRRMLYPSNK